MKKKILVVDDEVRIAQMIRRNLEAEGAYEVVIETDSTRALAVARKFEPDLVLMDVMMPEMDGGEVAALLSEDPKLHHVPVIFLTAIVTREETGGSSSEIGGRVFLAKPVRTEELVEAIEAAFKA